MDSTLVNELFMAFVQRIFGDSSSEQVNRVLIAQKAEQDTDKAKCVSHVLQARGYFHGLVFEDLEGYHRRRALNAYFPELHLLLPGSTIFVAQTLLVDPVVTRTYHLTVDECIDHSPRYREYRFLSPCSFAEKNDAITLNLMVDLESHRWLVKNIEVKIQGEVKRYAWVNNVYMSESGLACKFEFSTKKLDVAPVDVKEVLKEWDELRSETTKRLRR